MPAVVDRNERCPLCGLEFSAEGQGCRPSCPMAKGCKVICCPACGYSFPQETGVAGKLRQLFDRMKKKERGATP